MSSDAQPISPLKPEILPDPGAAQPESDAAFRTRLLRRLLIAGPIILSVLLLATWFVGDTWRFFSGSSSLVFPTVLMLLTASFLPSNVISFRNRHPVVRAINMVSAISVGFLSFGFVAAIACWLILEIAQFSGLNVDHQSLAVALYGAAALLTVCGIVNANWLRTTHVRVRLNGLPSAWHDARIVLVSDIHLGNIRGGRFIRRIIERLRDLNPDAVFIAGDMFDGTKVDVEAMTKPWSALTISRGIYFVTGNHDEFTDRAPRLAALARVGLRVLHNEKVEVQGLQIVGVHDGEAGDAKLFQDLLQQANLDRSRASILLTHQPASLSIPEAAGVSLQLSGHTHSGQFWPWNWLVSKIHGRFAYGLNKFGKMSVLTSSGAGTWGPPLRIGTRSEIVLIHLEREEDGMNFPSGS